MHGSNAEMVTVEHAGYALSLRDACLTRNEVMFLLKMYGGCIPLSPRRRFMVPERVLFRVTSEGETVTVKVSFRNLLQ
jgi:hypothetical protein